MLTITNVKKTFNKGTVNEKKALNGINLHLAPGDFVTIIGGNGAGKSTMLNMIAGVYPIDSGKIEIDGVNISREPEYKRAKYIGRVFQDPMRGTAANMEIQENLAMALRRGKSRGLGWGIKKNEKDFYREALAQLDLGLQTRMTSKVGLLSGGQRRPLADNTRFHFPAPSPFSSNRLLRAGTIFRPSAASPSGKNRPFPPDNNHSPPAARHPHHPQALSGRQTPRKGDLLLRFLPAALSYVPGPLSAPLLTPAPSAFLPSSSTNFCPSYAVLTLLYAY